MVELTRKDVEFFKTEGYLVKRNVLDQELMERARTRLWDGAPEGRKREDPRNLDRAPSPLKRKTLTKTIIDAVFAGTSANRVVKCGWSNSLLQIRMSGGWQSSC